MNSKTCLTVIAIVVGLLTWFSHSHGADNLTLLITIGGAIGLTSTGGSNKLLGVSFACFILIIVGLLFGLFAAGFLVALALLVIAILTAIGSVIFIQECW